MITNNGGELTFSNNATAGNATIINNNGDVDFSGVITGSVSAGSLGGSGTVELGANSLTVGGNNLSTEISGEISGPGGSLVKVGTGTLTLSSGNTYTGPTTVQAGTLLLTGSLAGDGVVSAAGTFSGTGSLGNLTNNGVVAPGVQGAGTLQASSYAGTGTLKITLNEGTNTALKVTGNANLTGSLLSLNVTRFAVGHYDVLSAGSITGTFIGVDAPTPPSYLTISTEYTSTDVLILMRPASSFLPVAATGNQSQVAAVLDSPASLHSDSLTTVINSILPLSAAQERQAFDQISGDALASFQEVALHNADVFTGQMHDRTLPSGSAGTALLGTPVQVASAAGVGGLGVPVASTPQNTYGPLVARPWIF